MVSVQEADFLQRVRVYDWSDQAREQEGPNCVLYSLHNGIQFLRARQEGRLPLAEDILSFDEQSWRKKIIRERLYPLDMDISETVLSIAECDALIHALGLLQPDDFTHSYPLFLFPQENISLDWLLKNMLSTLLRRAFS